jgi:hypothetical protein
VGTRLTEFYVAIAATVLLTVVVLGIIIVRSQRPQIPRTRAGLPPGAPDAPAALAAEVRQPGRGVAPSVLMLLGAAILGGAATAALGFMVGGWQTGAAARSETERAERAARDARVELAATICAARFSTEPGGMARLGVFRQLPSSSHEAHLQLNGWVLMPGVPQVIDGATRRCAERVRETAGVDSAKKKPE